MSARKKVPFDGDAVEGFRAQISESPERWSEFSLADGSVLGVSSEAKSDVNVHSGVDAQAADSTQTPTQVAIGHRQGISLTFQRLVREWRLQRGPASSHTEIVLCPAYQNIIAMGDDVVPLIMQQLGRGIIDHWFWALEVLTGAQPVEPEDAGNYARMTQAWLTWWEGQESDRGKRIGSLS